MHLSKSRKSRWTGFAYATDSWRSSLPIASAYYVQPRCGAIVLIQQWKRLVLLTLLVQFQAAKSPAKPGKSPNKSPEKTQAPTATSADSSGAVDAVQAAREAARKFNGERAASGRNLEIEFALGAKEKVSSENTRRASSPPRLERMRRLSSGKIILEEVPVEEDKEPATRRRRAVIGRDATTRQLVDEELGNMLNRLHAAERTIVIGEAQTGGDRKQSVRVAKTRQSISMDNPTIPKSASCSDLKSLVRSNSRRSTAATVSLQQTAGQSNPSTGWEKPAKKKKRLKKRFRRQRCGD